MRNNRHFIIVYLISFIGLIICVYLTYLHLGVLSGSLTEKSFCDVSDMISCEAVSASTYAEIGGIPISLIGGIVYVIIISLSVFGISMKNGFAVDSMKQIFLISLLSICFDIYLAVVSIFILKSICLLCCLTYIINLVNLILSKRYIQTSTLRAFIDLKGILFPLTGLRKNRDKKRDPYLKGMIKVVYNVLNLVIVICGIIVISMLRYYLSPEVQGFDYNRYMEYVNSAEKFDVDITNDPYYGNKDAKLVIIEFSDFECPSCKRFALQGKRVLTGYRDRIKLVFKNFPLHTECNAAIRRDIHPNACRLAEMAECAFRQDKFWVMHDLIFDKQEKIKHKKRLDSEMLTSFIEDAGLDKDDFSRCMSDDSAFVSIKEDTLWGKRLNISGTPTLVINGMKFGSLKPSVLRRIIEIELERAGG